MNAKQIQRIQSPGQMMPSLTVCEFSAPLVLRQSILSTIKVKWKHLGATTAQPRRSSKLTARGRWVLNCGEHKNHLFSAASLTTEFQTASRSNISTGTVHQKLMKWVSIAEQLHTSLRTWCALPNIGSILMLGCPASSRRYKGQVFSYF